jgi:energy-converting hydrogenase B subunit I
MRRDTEASGIVKEVACMLAIPITVFGLYVILHGHLTPGGGFAGGAVMATLIALFMVSFSREMVKRGVRKGPLSLSESLGLLAFIGLAFLGISAAFFYNFLANSGLFFGMPVAFGINPGSLATGGTAPLMNLAVGLEVFSGLSLIVLLMARYKPGGKSHG